MNHGGHVPGRDPQQNTYGPKALCGSALTPSASLTNGSVNAWSSAEGPPAASSGAGSGWTAGHSLPCPPATTAPYSSPGWSGNGFDAPPLQHGGPLGVATASAGGYPAQLPVPWDSSAWNEDHAVPGYTEEGGPGQGYLSSLHYGFPSTKTTGSDVDSVCAAAAQSLRTGQRTQVSAATTHESSGSFASDLTKDWRILTQPHRWKHLTIEEKAVVKQIRWASMTPNQRRNRHRTLTRRAKKRLQKMEEFIKKAPSEGESAAAAASVAAGEDLRKAGGGADSQATARPAKVKRDPAAPKSYPSKSDSQDPVRQSRAGNTTASAPDDGNASNKIKSV